MIKLFALLLFLSLPYITEANENPSITLNVDSSENSAYEKEEHIKDLLSLFSEKLGEHCEELNEKLREEGQVPCDENYCLMESLRTYEPNSIAISFSAFKYPYFGTGVMLSVTYKWKTPLKRLTICAHPTLTPIYSEFESQLRSRYMSIFN